jgi:branched-chain amino acid aminotransferase
MCRERDGFLTNRDVYYVDGEFVAAEDARIPVNDLAVLRGFGVFDFLRTYSGKPFHLKEHVERLENSARRIGLTLPWTGAEIIGIVTETLRQNRHAESGIRIVVTGGASTDFLTPQGNPRLLVLVSPLPAAPDHWYTAGVKIITFHFDRLITDAKSINYLAATMALKEARRRQAVEAVYVDRENRVQEGTTSNLFLFRGGLLTTPGKGILSGITRRVTLEIAETLFPIDIRDLSIEELVAADEVFITGTSKGVVPVVKVDEHVIGNGSPGPNTRRLMEAFRRYTEQYADTH